VNSRRKSSRIWRSKNENNVRLVFTARRYARAATYTVTRC